MELEEYKTIVRQVPQGFYTEYINYEKGLRLRNKTHSITDKIKKSLQVEIVFAALFLIFVSYVLYSFHNLYLELFAWVMVTFCICFIYYLLNLYRRISIFEASTLSVKESLIQLISIMVRFTRLYFQLTIVMIPVIIALTFISVSLGSFNLQENSFPSLSIQKLSLFFCGAAAWCIFMYFFTKWYIRQMYGNHLSCLKDHLMELEEGQ